jgi:hypothetical protein
MRSLVASLLGMTLSVLAACGEMPQPFRHEGLNPSVAPPGPRNVMVRPPDDGPSGNALAGAIVKRLADQDIPASTRSAVAGSWVLAAEPESRGAALTLRWRLASPDGEPPASFTQTIPAAVWEKAGPATLDRMADEVVGYFNPALHGADPAAPPAAPPRVPVVRIEPVAGLPGDGDTALPKALGNALRRLGIRLGGPDAELAVRGRVAVLPGRAGEEILEVTWMVLDGRDGRELGKAAQQGALPKGRLAGPWGALAGDVAAGGAEGIADIIAAIPQK